jgi:hypothetical protein
LGGDVVLWAIGVKQLFHIETMIESSVEIAVVQIRCPIRDAAGADF